ncbi:MAG: hypothetical protein KDC71_22745 [Acidobacteria bacterium]|nr:hypothetical protein [Acidobacteriota bacterium]
MISQIAKLAQVSYKFEPLNDGYGFRLETTERAQTYWPVQNWDWWDPNVVDQVLAFFQDGATHFYWLDDGQAGFLFYLNETQAEKLMLLEEIQLEFLV